MKSYHLLLATVVSYLVIHVKYKNNVRKNEEKEKGNNNKNLSNDMNKIKEGTFKQDATKIGR